jgi:hypothetical protein
MLNSITGKMFKKTKFDIIIPKALFNITLDLIFRVVNFKSSTTK